MSSVATPAGATVQSDLGQLPALDRLVGPYGLVSSVQRLPNHPGEPQFPIFTARQGDLRTVAPNVRENMGSRDVGTDMDGAGGSLFVDRARRICVAEALERYSSCRVDADDLIWATAEELGDEALDITTMPRCSEAELTGPRTWMAAPDVKAPMRWTKGYSLTRQRPLWVPAVSAWMHLQPKSVGERFNTPISTGCAAHTDLAAALVGALCEVIERDAIALTWLQRIPWPRVELDGIPDRLAPYAVRHERSHVRTVYFDATTDVGVPTLYSIDLTPDNEVLGQLVMCNAGLDPVESVAKLMRESASSRLAMQLPRELPADVHDFTAVFHGASYLGRPERVGAFDFLLSGERTVPLSAMPNLATGASDTDLRLVVDRLAAAGCEAVAVELTTDEARDVGFRVVRAIVPELMPLSFVHAARYLGHPRLYSAPAKLGYPVAAEADLNPLPQPFA